MIIIITILGLGILYSLYRIVKILTELSEIFRDALFSKGRVNLGNISENIDDLRMEIAIIAQQKKSENND